MGKLPFDLELNDIAALADIINDKNLGEIKLEDEDTGAKLVIKARPCPPPPPPQPFAPVFASVPHNAGIGEKPADTAPAKPPVKGNVVKSPIVGTYYSAPAPDKPPFVTVGQRVKKGDTLMIIESMKLMNEVQSDFDGVVKDIIVKNGEAVEFDQPIMIIG